MIKVNEETLDRAVDICGELFSEDGTNLLTEEENDYMLNAILNKCEKLYDEVKTMQEDMQENYVRKVDSIPEYGY